MTAPYRPYILWLPSWYPSGLEPYNGDFIKRQAAALSLIKEVQVLYIIRDKTGTITKDVLTERFSPGPLNEIIIYYYSLSTGISFVDKFLSARKYRRLYEEAVKEMIEMRGKPSLAHVQVGMKAGVIAQWLKRRYAVPYVVTEHWSGFLAEAEEKFSELPFYFRRLWTRIIKNAAGIAAVSGYLCSALIKTLSLSSCKVIPNVVDRNIFRLSDIPASGQKRFIHISGLAPLKNPKIILEAFAKVLAIFPDAKLEIFGYLGQDFQKIIGKMHMQHSVSIYPEVPQQVLAEALRRSEALILYSSYETFGCVIIEANASGIPVIVSDIPVFHETVKENVNGIFAGNNDPVTLSKKMIALIRNEVTFDKKAIADLAIQKYSYEAVGRQISEWYEKILTGKSF